MTNLNLTVNARYVPKTLRSRNRNVIKTFLMRCVVEGKTHFPSKNALAVYIEDIKYPFNLNYGKAPWYQIINNYEAIIGHLEMDGVIKGTFNDGKYRYKVDLQKAVSLI